MSGEFSDAVYQCAVEYVHAAESHRDAFYKLEALKLLKSPTAFELEQALNERGRLLLQCDSLFEKLAAAVHSAEQEQS